eukprot:TRINITY_DN42053_c0_g1_i1.p1 TRINITY_DN42053_c0_g1~~TRINITY_DN42053_c0_g1_i1.p1  ORF type:complete len:216 (-),score=28.11 TRINITY_DN42053_c0_g1_i1:107-754(-)
MDINVETSIRPLTVSIDPSSNPTVLTLKEKLLERKKNLSIPRQTIFYQGYLLDDDAIHLSDLGDDLDGTFSLVIPKAGKEKTVESDEEVRLVVGNARSFKVHLIPRNKPMPVTLRNQSIGIIYHIEGETMGFRKFHFMKYNVTAIDTLQVIGSWPDRTVVFKKGEEEVELDGTMKIYDEQHEQHESRLDQTVKTSKIIRNFCQAIASFVFEFAEM